MPPEACPCQIGVQNYGCFTLQIGQDRAVGAMIAVCQPAEINCFAAARATDRNCYMLSAGFFGCNIPKAKDTKPPAVIPSSVRTRWAAMWANAKINCASGTLQFIRNLAAG